MIGIVMTMPKTASKMTEFAVSPEKLSDEQLDEVVAALGEDLPGAIDYVAVAAAKSAEQSGEFAFVSKSPQEMQSKEDWTQLVGYLARLFASPYRRIAQEWTQRKYGVDIGFVNCCIVMAQQGKIDDDKALALQTNQQLTPDC